MTPSQRLKTLRDLEQDLNRYWREQKVIDDMKRNFGIYETHIEPPTEKEDADMPPIYQADFKPAPLLDRWTVAAIVAFAVLSFMVLAASLAFADPLPVLNANFKCPNVGEPCKVLVLTPAEEKILTGQNAILDTAAQGRNIELGGAVVYLKNKIATAPDGEVIPAPKPQAQAAPGTPEKQVTIPVGSGDAASGQGASPAATPAPAK